VAFDRGDEDFPSIENAHIAIAFDDEYVDFVDRLNRLHSSLSASAKVRLEKAWQLDRVAEHGEKLFPSEEISRAIIHRIMRARDVTQSEVSKHDFHTSTAGIGFRILHNFQLDLLRPTSSDILRSCEERMKHQNSEPLAHLRIPSIILFLIINGVSLGFILYSGALLGSALQTAVISSFLIWLSVDVFLVEIAYVYFFKVMFPQIIAEDLKNTKRYIIGKFSSSEDRREDGMLPLIYASHRLSGYARDSFEARVVSREYASMGEHGRVFIEPTLSESFWGFFSTRHLWIQDVIVKLVSSGCLSGGLTLLMYMLINFTSPTLAVCVISISCVVLWQVYAVYCSGTNRVTPSNVSSSPAKDPVVLMAEELYSVDSILYIPASFLLRYEYYNFPDQIEQFKDRIMASKLQLGSSIVEEKDFDDEDGSVGDDINIDMQSQHSSELSYMEKEDQLSQLPLRLVENASASIFESSFSHGVNDNDDISDSELSSISGLYSEITRSGAVDNRFQSIEEKNISTDHIEERERIATFADTLFGASEILLKTPKKKKRAIEAAGDTSTGRLGPTSLNSRPRPQLKVKAKMASAIIRSSDVRALSNNDSNSK